MTQSKRAVLQGQIAHLQYVDQAAGPDEHRLFARQRASRIAMLEKELAFLVDSPSEASVIVTFEGRSVTGSEGIGIGIVTRTMTAFKKLVGLLVGVIQEIPDTASGRARSGNVEHLQLTNLAHGSFGYELATRYPDGLFDATRTSQAIDQAWTCLSWPLRMRPPSWPPSSHSHRSCS